MIRKGPVTKLKEELNNKSVEAKENFDNYLRALAELDNYRKRMEKEFANFKVYSNEQLMTELIMIMDNFDRALVSGDINSDFESFYKGVEMIHRYLKEILERWGLKEFSGKGEVFNPARHEAVSVIETDEVPPDTIVDEISKGYILGEKILKPAQVTVAKACLDKKEGGIENG